MCHECDGPAGANPKHAIFAVGLSGYYSSHTLCQACWKDAQQLGGPGPNVSKRAEGVAAAEHGRRRAARGY
jgi:hypothetical protein